MAPPPLIYAVGLGAGFVLEWLLPDTDLPGALNLAGIALMIAATFLAVAFFGALRRARTPVDPYSPTSALVTTGPYRLSRNPGYLAMALLYAGIALVSDTPWAFATLIPALLVIRYGVIAREERYLERLFGEEYARYRSRTRRWI